MPRQVEKLPDDFTETPASPIFEAAPLSLDIDKNPLEIILPGEPISGSQLKFNRTTGSAYRPAQHKQRVFTIYEYACNVVGEERRPYYKKGTPLAMGVEFYFSYRSGDYRTGKHAGELKPNAPVYVLGNKDLDNLLKPLKDGLKGVVYADDKQIVKYLDITKMYSESPRTVIRVKELY
jgi:Holliday junction resolvase RusA-like endonuclease